MPPPTDTVRFINDKTSQHAPVGDIAECVSKSVALVEALGSDIKKFEFGSGLVESYRGTYEVRSGNDDVRTDLRTLVWCLRDPSQNSNTQLQYQLNKVPTLGLQ